MSEPKDKIFVQHDDKVKERMAIIKHKLVVMSGKGGVGKTTVAVNLAYSLSEQGSKVGILDTDLHGPNVSKMLGIEKSVLRSSDKGIIPVEINKNLVSISLGSLGNDPDQPIIWRGPAKNAVIKQFISEVLWGELDYLIIDSPPGTGDEPLSVCQLIPDITGIIIVTTPQDVALLDARKSVMFAQKLGVPVIGIIENMSGFICPHCGKETDIFKRGGAEKAAKEFNIRFLGSVPFETELVELADKGIPFIACDNSSKAKDSFIKISKTIKDAVESNKSEPVKE